MNALKSKRIAWILFSVVFADSSVHTTGDIFKVPFLCVDYILATLFISCNYLSLFAVEEGQ